jgi:hypothetical protein
MSAAIPPPFVSSSCASSLSSPYRLSWRTDDDGDNAAADAPALRQFSTSPFTLLCWYLAVATLCFRSTFKLIRLEDVAAAASAKGPVSSLLSHYQEPAAQLHQGLLQILHYTGHWKSRWWYVHLVLRWMGNADGGQVFRMLTTSPTIRLKPR